MNHIRIDNDLPLLYKDYKEVYNQKSKEKKRKASNENFMKEFKDSEKKESNNDKIQLMITKSSVMILKTRFAVTKMIMESLSFEIIVRRSGDDSRSLEDLNLKVSEVIICYGRNCM